MLRIPSSSSLRQFARFAAGGGGVAVVTVAVYATAVSVMGVAPLVANLAAFLLQLALSYRVHRLWSFRAGAASTRGRVRFAVVSGVALASNSLWVFLLTSLAGLPGWTAIVPMVCVTPILTYAMARWWVFDAGGAATAAS